MEERALILGAAGFLGSHVVKHLLTLGWSVTCVVRDPDDPYVRTRLGPYLSDLRLVSGDANSPQVLRRLVANADVVFPFAGHSGAARSMRAPVEDAMANAVGHLAVLEVLRVSNPGARIVFPGSRLQYGRVTRLPVAEDHPQEPTSIYGLHKATAESYYRLYCAVHGLQTTCLRISNPYGPHQDRPDRAFGIVGTFMATAAAGDPIKLYGGGIQLRDYVYVDDVADVCVKSVTSPTAVGEVFNVGGSEATSLRQMAEAVIEVVGQGRIEETPWPPLEGSIETGDYVSDVSRAREQLGWVPRVPLSDGLAMTWETISDQSPPPNLAS